MRLMYACIGLAVSGSADCDVQVMQKYLLSANATCLLQAPSEMYLLILDRLREQPFLRGLRFVWSSSENFQRNKER